MYVVTVNILHVHIFVHIHVANVIVQPFGTSAETAHTIYKRRYSLLSAVLITFNCLADNLVPLIEILG